jgi:uncharacterized protein YndB with AHSA1/START domain
MTETAAAREITITRVYDAPRELVWRAWTEPERLAQWWGPAGWTTDPADVRMEVRPGGVFRVTSVSAEDGSAMTVEGVYREVEEPVRLVLEEDGEGAWHDGAVSELTLTDLGDGRTEMAFATSIRTTEEMAGTARAGLAASFDQLARHLS